MRFSLILLILLLFVQLLSAQVQRRQLPAKRTTASLKIDGNIDETAWKEAVQATNFVEQRPNPGRLQDSANRTEVYLLYDNTSVYIGGFCYERTRDSISRELVGRDNIGVNDFIGITLDTYYDKINAVGFYVTPYGEQFDVKYTPNDEDINWSAVWQSAAKIHDNGWSFEMRIPYSALRFVSKENQTWGLNIIRRRQKTGQQFTWNPVDPKVNGFVNQEGEWIGIEKIEAPIRLSFSPYLSGYVSHYQPAQKDWGTSLNGGMDVKYGINESFTLDMTLIPDFGQVQSDNQVLNLSPFEVRFNENRAFFTEGTELFNKGNLFYSRRIGGEPIHYWSVNSMIQPGDKILSNPRESKLLNASKVSGRTKKGLGVGFFNAITRPMYAEIENSAKEVYKIETNPLTNYNILVLDQTLKNNSSVSLINTNVLRNGDAYDANVSAALFNFNNKKNSFNWNGKFALSQLTNPADKNTNGYSHSVGFGKNGGRWRFNLSQELVDDKYDIRDMGFFNNNNYLDHHFWTGYRWLEPKKWYNRISLNYNASLSRRYNPGDYQIFYTNVNANAQLKNLWFVGAFIGFNAKENDFYEPRLPDRFFSRPGSLRFNVWFETNSAKKYFFGTEFFKSYNQLFNARRTNFYLWHRYRFSDKFSLSHDIFLGPSINEAGFYGFHRNSNTGSIEDVLFAKRDRSTIENVLRAKYNFNNRSGITFRARHYWSQVKQNELYDLQSNGSLSPTKHSGTNLVHRNFNTFTIDAQYTLQFAPGSFINIVWKDESIISNTNVSHRYFKNFDHTISSPQNNNLSIKVIYFIDYLDIQKWGKEKR